MEQTCREEGNNERKRQLKKDKEGLRETDRDDRKEEKQRQLNKDKEGLRDRQE